MCLVGCGTLQAAGSAESNKTLSLEDVTVFRQLVVFLNHLLLHELMKFSVGSNGGVSLGQSLCVPGTATACVGQFDNRKQFHFPSLQTNCDDLF